MRPLDHVSRTDLESLLRARQLDRTLTTALPPIDPHDEYAIGPSGVAGLDAALDGGFPRGQLSEIVGARSSGRASLLIRLLAAATARGELVALIDALDMFDVGSGAAAGVDLGRLLWIRGHVTAHPGPCRDRNQRAMEQAIRALALVLGAGNFGLVVFDAGEAPADALRRLPFTTWLRLQRMIEGRQTIAVLVGSEPMARSSAGLTVRLGQVGSACGPRDPSTKLRVDLSQSKVEESESAPAAMPTLRPFDKLRVDLSKVEGRGISVSTRGASAEKMAVQKAGIRFDSQLFEGLDVEAHVIRARARGREDTRVVLATSAVEL